MSAAKPESVGAKLDRVLRTTAYRVKAPLNLVLKVGAKCPSMDRHLSKRKGAGAAMISACNPLGKRLSDEENHQRERALLAVVKTMGLEHWAALATPANGGPPEPSLLILPIELEAAKAIAKNFERFALVFHTKGGKSELIYTGLEPKR